MPTRSARVTLVSGMPVYCDRLTPPYFGLPQDGVLAPERTADEAGE